jgi:hypothetical protein
VYPASQRVLSGGCVLHISESTFWRLCTLHLRKYFLKVVYPASPKVLSGGCVPCISESTFWRLCTPYLRKYFLEVVYPASQKVLSGGCISRILETISCFYAPMFRRGLGFHSIILKRPTKYSKLRPAD